MKKLIFGGILLAITLLVSGGCSQAPQYEDVIEFRNNCEAYPHRFDRKEIVYSSVHLLIVKKRFLLLETGEKLVYQVYMRRCGEFVVEELVRLGEIEIHDYSGGSTLQFFTDLTVEQASVRLMRSYAPTPEE